jgi:hypothetical protein
MIEEKEKIVDYGYGKYKVYLPDDEKKAREVWKKLKMMIDPLFELKEG